MSLVDSGSGEELTAKNQLCRLDHPHIMDGESYSILTLHILDGIWDAPAIALLDISLCLWKISFSFLASQD